MLHGGNQLNLCISMQPQSNWQSRQCSHHVPQPSFKCLLIIFHNKMNWKQIKTENKTTIRNFKSVANTMTNTRNNSLFIFWEVLIWINQILCGSRTSNTFPYKPEYRKLSNNGSRHWMCGQIIDLHLVFGMLFWFKIKTLPLWDFYFGEVPVKAD